MEIGEYYNNSFKGNKLKHISQIESQKTRIAYLERVEAFDQATNLWKKLLVALYSV